MNLIKITIDEKPHARLFSDFCIKKDPINGSWRRQPDLNW